MVQSVLPQGPTAEHGNSTNIVSDSQSSPVSTAPEQAGHEVDTNSLQDSAYHSVERQDASLTKDTHSTKTKISTNIKVRQIPGSHLLIFRNEGDAHIIKRYKSIQPAIELWLIDAITSSKQNMENLSIELQMIETTVINFFASNLIQSQLKLVNDGTAPLLEALRSTYEDLACG
ncbi:hypothetical protein IQ07DRAFT_138943 [Pyrenochaeta sp. DS3sAY3a]|nr:hypothetical protein IQ07DRAFT_138943 [Pyrenochaeta sp. DS3sAY3a]